MLLLKNKINEEKIQLQKIKIDYLRKIKEYCNLSYRDNQTFEKFKNEDKLCIFHCGNIKIFDTILKKYPNIAKIKLIITYYT